MAEPATDNVENARERAILGSDIAVNPAYILDLSKGAKMNAVDLNIYYGHNHAIKNVNLAVTERQVTALMGPSGCGKSTFLRALNRMHDLTPSATVVGAVMLDGQNIYAPQTDIVRLRQRVGMVFQRPNVFPRSIFENVAYGLRIQGGYTARAIRDRVMQSLERAALWDEVKDRLDASALGLSGGQQQRLCIARALAVEPEVLLMDEPCSALDPIATLKIEELIDELKQRYTIVLVTHNLQQAGRVSDYTGFFLLGRLIEFAPTKQLFSFPAVQATDDFLTGRFG